MSPHVNDLASSFVQMAKAFEELPQVQEALNASVQHANELADRIQRLEMKLLDRSNEVNELHEKVRATEVARDDAELRFLEAEERTDKALAFVRMVQGNAGSLMDHLSPPKPEPVPEPVVEAPPAQGESATLPPVDTAIPSVVQSSGNASSSGDAPIQGSSSEEQGSRPTSTATVETSTEGERASLPTQVPPAPTSGTTTPAEPIGSFKDPGVPLPYFGKRYVDVAGYISRWDWIAGGGTDADYDYRGVSATG